MSQLILHSQKIIMEILIRVPLFCSNRNESLARSVQFSRALTETPVPLAASCSDLFFRTNVKRVRTVEPL